MGVFDPAGTGLAARRRAPFVVVSADPRLTAERTLAPGPGIAFVDHGPDASLEVKVGPHTHELPEQGGKLDHGLALLGLGDDDHAQYAHLAGRAGGQALSGGTGAAEALTISSTAAAAKGKVNLGAASAYDEAHVRLGIGTASPAHRVHVKDATATPDGPPDAGVVVEDSQAVPRVVRLGLGAGDTAQVGTASGHQLDLVAGGAPRVRLLADGTVQLWPSGVRTADAVPGHIRIGVPYSTTGHLQLANSLGAGVMTLRTFDGGLHGTIVLPKAAGFMRLGLTAARFAELSLTDASTFVVALEFILHPGPVHHVRVLVPWRTASATAGIRLGLRRTGLPPVFVRAVLRVWDFAAQPAASFARLVTAVAPGAVESVGASTPAGEHLAEIEGVFGVSEGTMFQVLVAQNVADAANPTVVLGGRTVTIEPAWMV